MKGYLIFSVLRYVLSVKLVFVPEYMFEDSENHRSGKVFTEAEKDFIFGEISSSWKVKPAFIQEAIYENGKVTKTGKLELVISDLEFDQQVSIIKKGWMES